MLKPIYSHGCDEKSHPGHLPLLSSRQDWKFARFQHVMNEASSKRLNYVRTIFYPPNARLVLLCLLRLRHTLHGVGCLASHHERTRLTATTLNGAIIVRCKITKKYLFNARK